MRKLPAPVVGFRRFRKHFDNQSWIEQGIQLRVLELRFAADDHDIRVGIKTGLRNLGPQIKRKDFTRRALQLRYQLNSSFSEDFATLARHVAEKTWAFPLCVLCVTSL